MIPGHPGHKAGALVVLLAGGEGPVGAWREEIETRSHGGGGEGRVRGGKGGGKGGGKNRV